MPLGDRLFLDITDYAMRCRYGIVTGMKARNALSVCSVIAVLAMTCSATLAAQSSDFAALKAHWSFDEGRDWHHMPMPYKYDGVKAAELTGKADDMLLNEQQQPDNEAWVSWRHRGVFYSPRKK